MKYRKKKTKQKKNRYRGQSYAGFDSNEIFEDKENEEKKVRRSERWRFMARVQQSAAAAVIRHNNKK